MHLIVQPFSAYLVTTSPEAASFIDRRLIFASPSMTKSGPAFGSSLRAASSDHVRKPNDLMRSLRTFSATGDGCAGASGASASRVTMRTPTRGSPLARMKSMRSLRDISFSDFCTAFTLTTASVVIDTRPSLPFCGRALAHHGA